MQQWETSSFRQGRTVKSWQRSSWSWSWKKAGNESCRPLGLGTAPVGEQWAAVVASVEGSLLSSLSARRTYHCDLERCFLFCSLFKLNPVEQHGWAVKQFLTYEEELQRAHGSMCHLEAHFQMLETCLVVLQWRHRIFWSWRMPLVSSKPSRSAGDEEKMYAVNQN